MAFLVILLCPHGPRCPHIVPVVPTSSPHRPHVVPIISRRSPCCLHGLWSHMSSPSSPHCPCHPHIVPIIPPLSPCRPQHPQKVPMWSPWSVVSTCCLCHPHIVPVIPTLSRRSPHHPQPPRYPLHPPLTPLGGWGPRICKNAIRFELIKIF